MRDVSQADKVWFRQQIRQAVRQVLYEEFGEVLQFLKAVNEKADIQAVEKLVEKPKTDRRPLTEYERKRMRGSTGDHY